MTAAVARYQGNWVELIFAKTSGIVKCGLWKGEKSIPEVFSNLTRPDFFQCCLKEANGVMGRDHHQKLFKWSMHSYPAEVTAPFSSSNGCFSIKAPRFFSRFSTVNIKRKDRCWLNWWRLLKQRTRECFHVTIIFPYIRKCKQRFKETLHHYSSIMLDLLVSLLCPK